MLYIKKKYIIIFLCIIILTSAISKIFFISSKKDTQSQETKILNSNIEEKASKELFSEYYEKANQKIKNMTLEEKIGQMLLVRLPNENQLQELEKYKFAGYLYFEKDFQNKTEEVVKNEIQSLQKVSDIPLLIAVDEEGGKVVRISSNSKLVKEKFKSPRELYMSGGFEEIKRDTVNKSKILYNLGINLNLAPVIDVSTKREDYIYERTLGEGTRLTAIYAETVIKASKDTKVSYTLKHFPGYGNNKDTHKQNSIDTKTYKEILTFDIPAFRVGIEAGAEAIMVSHNIVTSIDENNPASLSKKVHDILRSNLHFTGIIITDDLAMEAVKNDEDATVKAVLAGNDLIITTDYIKSVETVKRAVQDGKIKIEIINNAVRNIIAWKYYKKML